MTRLLSLACYAFAFYLGMRYGQDQYRVSAMRGLFPRISRRDAIRTHRSMERGR